MKIMANPEKMKIEKQMIEQDDNSEKEMYVIANTPYAFHKKCKTKNWCARITGSDEKYGLKRKFLDRVHKAYVIQEKPKSGDIFEVHAEQWSWTGKRSNDEGGFYQLNTDGTFTEIKKEEVMALFPLPPKEEKQPLKETF